MQVWLARLAGCTWDHYDAVVMTLSTNVARPLAVGRTAPAGASGWQAVPLWHRRRLTLPFIGLFTAL